MHWNKGTPNSAEDQGKWYKNTWWEQLDNGEQYTPTRKFLTVLAFIPYVFFCSICRSKAVFCSRSPFSLIFIVSLHNFHLHRQCIYTHTTKIILAPLNTHSIRASLFSNRPPRSFFFSSYETLWATGPLFINFIALAFVVIPKLPSMHTVRLFKINEE
jgi:hypothetical protein